MSKCIENIFIGMNGCFVQTMDFDKKEENFTKMVNDNQNCKEDCYFALKYSIAPQLNW